MQQAINIGQRLRELREAAELSQGEIERRTHKALRQTYLSRWERADETGAVPTQHDIEQFVAVVAKTERDHKRLTAELVPMVRDFKKRRQEAQRLKVVAREQVRQRDPEAHVQVGHTHEDALAFGASVVALREAQSLKRTTLARKAHMHPNHLAQIEAGRTMPTKATIVKLAKALDAALVRSKTDGLVLAPPKAAKGPALAVIDVRPVAQAALPGQWTKVPGLFYEEELGLLIGTVIPIDRRIGGDDVGPINTTNFREVGKDARGKALIAVFRCKAEETSGRRVTEMAVE